MVMGVAKIEGHNV